MNEIANNFFSAGDKSIPEMHFRQHRFIYNACGQFTKNKERIKRFKETGDSKYIYQNELNIAYFQHNMAFGDFKGTLSCQRQFLATKIPLKIIKNVFNFSLKALFILKIFKFLP